MIATNAQDKRVLVKGAGVLLLIIVTARVLPAAVTWSNGIEASAASLVALVAEQQRHIDALPITLDSLVARQVRYADLDSLTFEGNSPVLAGAALAELLSSAATEAKAQIANVQVRTDSATRGAFIPVQVYASVKGDLAVITRLLKSLDEGPKLLRTREISIEVQQDQSLVPTGGEVLRADLIVEGLVRNPAPRVSVVR